MNRIELGSRDTARQNASPHYWVFSLKRRPPGSGVVTIGTHCRNRNTAENRLEAAGFAGDLWEVISLLHWRPDMTEPEERVKL